MKIVSQLGAFFGMLFSVMTSNKYISLIESKIVAEKLQGVMDSKDKSDLVNQFIKFINNGCRYVEKTVDKVEELLVPILSGDALTITLSADLQRTIEADDFRDDVFDHTNVKDSFNDFLNTAKQYAKEVTLRVSETIDVDMYAVSRSASMSQIFNSLNVNLDSLCFTPQEIIVFVRQFQGCLNNDTGTFFLSKRNDQFCIVRVRNGGDWGKGQRFLVRVFPDHFGAHIEGIGASVIFGSKAARPRIVVPRQ